jgi:hypothetical protein
MAKKTDKGKSLYESSESGKTFDKIFEHYERSWQDLVQPNIASFTEKEAMYIGKNLDSITGEETNASVYDPRLATMTIERCGRVMAQNPSGKSLAMSGDDKGKNMLMNLLQDKWVLPNANSQFTFLIKNRLWDLYSLIYGSMFALVDRVDTDTYFGPDMWLLPIRHCRPQPGRFSIKDSDYFGVSTWVTKEWLLARNKDTWKNIDKVLTKLKEGGSQPPGDKDSNERSFIETDRQPSVSKTKDFKLIEIYTEYRNDRWLTVAPQYKDEQLVLRDIENPHGDDKIPVAAKYCFPMLDSIYGLGEFERGKTLQYALNSLWNLYLDGVKMSIFPPIQMVADDVVPSSILMEPAAKWLLTKPGAKIETFNASPQGINTFQNTYQFLLGAIQNLGGSSDTTVQQSTDQQMGKTPQALKMQAARESTRDAWDRFMMEESLQEVMSRFVNLTANGLDKNVELRLFSKEIKEIQAIYPDVTEYLDGSDRGKVSISKKLFENAKFDYEITKGSTYKADQQQENENITNLLNFTMQNYQVLAPALQSNGKKVNIGELYQRSIISSGIQDWEKIVVDLTPQDQQGMQMMDQNQQMMQQLSAKPGSMDQYMANQMGPGSPQETGGGQPPQMPPSQQPPGQQGAQQGPLSGSFQDPAIQELANQIFGNGAGNPAIR